MGGERRRKRNGKERDLCHEGNARWHSAGRRRNDFREFFLAGAKTNVDSGNI